MDPVEVAESDCLVTPSDMDPFERQIESQDLRLVSHRHAGAVQKQKSQLASSNEPSVLYSEVLVSFNAGAMPAFKLSISKCLLEASNPEVSAADSARRNGMGLTDVGRMARASVDQPMWWRSRKREDAAERAARHGRLVSSLSTRPSRTQPIGTTGGKTSAMVSKDPFAARRADSAVSVGSVGSAAVRMDPSVAKRHQSPFPPLHLSAANATSMENLAQNLVSRNVRLYESFLLDNHSQVDETQWKFVAAKDDLRAYGELPRATESPHPGYQLETPAADVPAVMITGSVVGDLDDVMYGVVCPTTEQMRVKTSYIHDDIPSSCVLANLVDPTPDAPFNSVTIKWVEVHVPLAVRPVVKHRDFVYLETTGIERLRNGERVGYHIVHSVQFPETPALETHFRGNSSISILYRQRTKNVTDVYIKGFFNPAGGIMRQIVIRSSARILLSVAKDVYCSHMKKLAWALRQKYNGETSSSSSECTEGSSNSSLDDKCCSGCGKKQSVFVQAASRTNRGAKILQKKRHCKICARYMCVDCRRQHQLTFLLPNHRLKQRLVTICRSCEAEALAESAAAIARDEQLQSNQLQRWDSDDVSNTTMSAQSE